MKYLYLLLLSVSLQTATHAQTFTKDRDKIETAKTNMQAAMEQYASCSINGNIDKCLETLIASAKTGFEKYVVAGMLYNTVPEKSFELHKAAMQAEPLNLYTNFEYAIGLHRKGMYKEAAEIYERCLPFMQTDYSIYTWLADCYINTGDIPRALENWKKADHANHHTSIENAIYVIYGHPDQPLKRNELRNEIAKGNKQAFYELIFKDMNWEVDWWNKPVMSDMLWADMALAKSKFTETDADYKTAMVYMKIKTLAEPPLIDTMGAGGSTKADQISDSIKAILLQSHLLIGTYPIPIYGSMASDLLRICFNNQILVENDFYTKRGTELLDAAKASKDKELLNIYAYLQGTVSHKIDPEIDKMGWKEFHDERFAVSYIIGQKKTQSDDPELAEAIAAFPNSSILMGKKAYRAKMENKPVKQLLIETIKLEFRTLASEDAHFSNKLNNYFLLLTQEEK